MLGLKSLLVYTVLVGAPLLSAQEIPTPWLSSWTITSDYGPRDMDDGPALKWDFHRGIDYGGTAGESIPAVEAGVIEAIGYDGGWYIAVKNTGVKPERRWTYMHIFSGTNPIIPVTSGNWELRSANLKKAGTAEIDASHVIIRWSTKPELKAEKIFSLARYAGREVYIGTTPVLNTAGATITSSGTVSQHDSIAPVGTSGNVDAHLHLSLNQGNDNPLLYLTHTDGVISAEIPNPPEGYLFRHAELAALYPIKVRVDSTAGLDMDKLNLVIVDSQGTRHLVGHWSQPMFSYGGRSDREDFGGVWNSTAVAPCVGGVACVAPLDADSSKSDNQPGLDEFTYKFPFGSLSLPDGEYSLEAVVTDVNKNQYTLLPRSFRIDTTQPFFHLSSISPLYDNFRGTSTLNPSTLERAHTLDFEDAVAGISALVISGPAGFEGYSHVFEPPVSTTTLSFENMPLGPYEIRAVDAAGNESIAPFKIVDLGVEVSTPDSVFHGLEVTSTPTEYSEKFGCRLAVKTESSSPIERVDLFSIGNGENMPTLVKSIPGSEVGPVATFDTGINSGLYYSTNNYIVQVWSKDGNSRSRVFGVRGDSEQIPVVEGIYSNTYFDGAFIMPQTGARQGTFSSQVVDLRSKPYRVGGAVFNSVPGFPYNAFNNIRNPDIISIPDGSSEKFYGLPIGGYQEIGTIEARLTSSDSADMSGGSDMLMGKRHYFAVSDPESYTNNGSTCSSAGIERWYYYCYTETKMSAGIFPLGRYVQSKLIFDLPAPSNIVSGNCAVGHDVICEEGHGFTIRGLSLASHTGALIESINYYPAGENAILPGKNVKVPLGSGVYVNFDRIDSVGAMGLSVQHGETLPGFVSVPVAHSYNVTGGLVFGEADISFPYEPSGLSAEQQSQIRVVRVVDSSKGLFEVLPTTLDAGNKLVSAKVTSFGKLMVVAPAYATPHPVSGGAVGGNPELEFVSNIPVSLERISETSVYSGVMSKNLALNGLATVGEVYYIGPDDTALAPAGAIRMRYDKAKLASMGIPDTEVGLYEFSSDGSLLFKLPRQSINAETGEIAAEVPKLYSLFGVLGKSYQPRSMDIMLPETLLEYNGPVHYAATGEVYIASGTKVSLSASDWDDEYKTGLLASYYFRDRHPDFVCLKTGRDITKPGGTCENPVYGGEFTLEEGTHTIYYQSADNAKNFEFVKSTEVYVDATAPNAELKINGVAQADGASAQAADGDSITISAEDIVSRELASGWTTTHMLINIAPEACENNGTGGGINGDGTGVGSCENPYYPGTFTLPEGSYTIYYAAMDNVGNMSELKRVNVAVSPKTTLGVAWVSTGSINWTWDAVVDAVSYSLSSPFAGNISGNLASNVTSYVQGNLSPNTIYSARLNIAGEVENFSTDVSSAVTLANVPGVPEVFAIGQYPSVVLGQSDLVSRGSGLTQTNLKAPTASAVDSAGNLWVSDSGNLRVLRFPKGQTTGMGADLVIGQPDFVSRQDSMSQNRFSGRLAGIAIDQAGALWVANGCRVLRFSPPFANGMNADLVLGGHSYSYCDNPVNAWGIKFDRKGSLWAAGWENNRILRFSPPFTSGQGADLALNWFTYLSSATGIQMTGSFSSPRDIDMDSRGNMYVADFGYGRILGFAPPFYNGMRASLVIGQADFGSYEHGIVSANRLYQPSSVSFDGFDALYVADFGNSRVLKFRPPFSSNMNASLVLGQPDFNTNFNLNVANSFNLNFSAEVDGFIASDSDGRLWVSDTYDNRVLSFEPVYTGIFTGISASGFTVNWLAAGNPAATEYTAEISPDGGFSYGVISSGRTTALSNPFGNLAANTGYYARVRSINLDGVESSWTNLNSVTTVPAAPQGLAGNSADSGSILWTWDAQAGLKYEIFSSTGGQLSPVLPEGTSYYIQSGLEPNRPYSVYLRAINLSGYADTPPLSRFTLSAIPVAVEPFTMGQGVGVTLGGAPGRGESKFDFSRNIGSGPDGAVWVHDATNCRLLRFPAPQTDYMNADVVLGQSDFNSTICDVAPDRIAMGAGGVAFDRTGALWLADAINNRVLRFSPPFSNGKAADLVIGQTNLYSKTAGLAADKLANPSSLSFDSNGNLWVVDIGNRRILKFTAPLVTGQSAALVLGQPDFTSKYDIPTSSAYFGPKDIAWDSDGNLWAAVNMVLTEGGWESRLLRFTPPFANGISPSLILRSAGLSFTPYGFVEPEYLAFDETGFMYLTAGDRVLRYAPPFSSDMKPSGVLGKDSFNSNSGGTLQDPRGLAVYNSSSGPVLWVSDPGSFKVVSFNASESSFYDVHPSSVSVKWSITGNPPGTEFQAELSVSRDFGALAAQGAWLNTNTYTFTGLQGNTTYYARVKSRNAEGRESAGAYLGKTLTPSDIVYLAAYSTVTVGAAPEATFLSVYGGSVTLVSTATGSGAYALAAAGGMTLLSNIYEIGPEGDYAPPAIVVFNYSESALAGTGLLEEDLAIYEHFEGIGWVLLPGQSLDAGADKISVPVTRIASLFGVFGTVRDRVAPVTSLVLESGVWRGPAGDTYLNGRSSAALSAYDPVVYGTFTGVAYTEYRVYEGTSSAFARYSGPFGLGEGRRMLEFRSADKAGNLEVAGSSVIYVDATAPETALSISGRRGLSGWFVSPVEITLVSSDALSGVREINYSLAVSTEYLAYAGQIKIASEGTHAIRYYAADQVGNIELQKNAAPGMDLSAPLVSVALEPVPNSYGWNSSSVAVAFTGTDTVSGLAYCVQAATVSTEGAAQPVSGYCADRAGWSSTTTVAVSIDLGAPVVSVHVNSAANAAGWHNGGLSVVFTGTDAVSGIETCGPVLPAPPEGRSVVVEGYCSDYAGNRSTTAVTLNIDRSAPLVIVSSPAAGSLFEVGRDQIAVRFSVTDNLDTAPVFSARLRRMQDKGAPGDNRPAELPVVDGQIIESTELDDGLWRLEIAAADAAGNSTATVGGLFEVISDTMPPRTELVVGTPKLAGALTYISTATPLGFSVVDDMQVEDDGQGGGAEATYLSIDGAPAAAVKGVVYLYGDGRHELTYHTVDRSGNAEAQQTVVFYVDGLAPEAKMSFEGAFLEDPTGLYISTLTSVAVAAAEPASSGAASGLAGVYISDSDGVYDVYTGTFTALEGEHTYTYYASDRLGNTSRSVSVPLFADGTPPSISIEFSSAPEAVIGGVRVSTDTVITFSAADPPSNGSASGLTGIWYKVDGSSEMPFNDGFPLAQGAHKITYWSADRVGNRSPLAELVVLSGTEMRVVEARLSPDTLNPKSEGTWLEADLSVSSGIAAAFVPDSVLITRVNGVILSTPIYATWNEHSGADSCKKEGKEVFCSERVKFDRQALLSVLPAETLSLVTIEGSFEDDAMFSAECQVRVLSLERITRARGGSVAHASAVVEVPAKALRADADISVITLRETGEARREHDSRAVAAALERRGMPYEFGPEGLTFSGTVEISLPYEDYAPAREKLLIAYWNPESREWEPLASTVDPARKVVKAKVGHFSEYQVMASIIERTKMAKITSTLSAISPAPLQTGPDPAFRLGEVYVYPNPALRGAVPVLHIETGIADRVNILIYTVSGRQAHEHTLTGLPVALDDGNGLSYAYEYAWRDSVPSGVYYYHLEAEKGGQKIRKSGKFAVVR